MQLIHIKAAHFMRFDKVDITLPERGLFCVQGSNESGKSTIGHLIYFALSGLGPKGESAEQLINWEKNQMKVKLTFLHCGEKFQLVRQVDRDGSNFSKLAKGTEVIAQGNTAIALALQREMGYAPQDLMRSFLVTHRIIQNLVHEPIQNHVDYMLGLDHLQSLASEARKESEDFEQQLCKEMARDKRLRDEQRAIGYDGEDDLACQNELGVLERDLHQCQADGERAEGDIQYLRNMQDVIEKSGRALPSKVDFENSENLERALAVAIGSFEKLSLRESKKGLLDASILSIKAMRDYCRDRGAFLSIYETHLDKLRQEIGLNEPPLPSSLAAQEVQLQEQIAQHKNRSFQCAMGAITFGLLSFAAVAMVALRSMFWKALQGTALETFFYEGAGSSFRMAMETMLLGNGPLGLPTDPRPWAILAFLGLLTFLFVVLSSMASKKRASCNAELEQVSLRKNKLKVSFHGLLAADIKEMSEISLAVEHHGSEELQDEYRAFRNRHSLMEQKAYNIDQMIHETRENLEEIVGQLKLERHQSESRNEEFKAKYSQLDDQVEKTQVRLKEFLDKKTRVELLEEELGKMGGAITELKQQRNVKVSMAKLAEGTLTTVRDRLRRDLTVSYKEIMPKITNDRYASIRLGKNFEIEVFSEERGDFVPLHHLSSGTNDLFVLIFQMILVQGFMDAREHDKHFLFLDEPLLAVDGQRYQKLTDILPSLCGGLQQIFLCRPPEQQMGAYVIETRLENKEVIVNFTNEASPQD
jgi:hypothetical protein